MLFIYSIIWFIGGDGVNKLSTNQLFSTNFLKKIITLGFYMERFSNRIYNIKPIYLDGTRLSGFTSRYR